MDKTHSIEFDGTGDEPIYRTADEAVSDGATDGHVCKYCSEEVDPDTAVKVRRDGDGSVYYIHIGCLHARLREVEEEEGQ